MACLLVGRSDVAGLFHHDERTVSESTVRASSTGRARLSRGRVLGMASEKETLTLNGREVTVSNPRKVYFPETGHTKLDLVKYYIAVSDGALSLIHISEPTRL